MMAATEFRQDDFNKFLIDNNVVGFFPDGRTLKSGRFSYWYANCRNLTDSVGLADRTADFLMTFLKSKGIDYDYIYGVPEGVTKLADIANYKRGMVMKKPEHPLVIGRTTPKEHGDPKDRFFVGPVKQGDRVVVVEDVTTTGGSMLSSLDALRQAGMVIMAVIALVNRMELRDDGKSVAQCVKEKGARYIEMSRANDLIPLAINKYSPDKGMLKNFQDKYNEFAIEKIKVV